jgi:hypothetical protein
VSFELQEKGIASSFELREKEGITRYGFRVQGSLAGYNPALFQAIGTDRK